MALRQVYAAGSASTSAATSFPIYLGRSVASNGVNIVTLAVAGQMAGAQVKLQLAPSTAGPWFDIASTTVSTSAVINIEIADGFYIRPHLYSVSAGVTSVDAWIGIGSYSRR